MYLLIMRYIITESQFMKLKFRRRLQEFDDYIKETPIYKFPCDHGNNSDEFLEEIVWELTHELKHEGVSDEFIDLVKHYIIKTKGPSLIAHFNKTCSSESA